MLLTLECQLHGTTLFFSGLVKFGFCGDFADVMVVEKMGNEPYFRDRVLGFGGGVVIFFSEWTCPNMLIKSSDRLSSCFSCMATRGICQLTLMSVETSKLGEVIATRGDIWTDS